MWIVEAQVSNRTINLLTAVVFVPGSGNMVDWRMV